MSARLSDFAVDPFELARAQLVRDADATRGLPGLFAAKRDKMMRDAHAFLRGSVELFYTMVGADQALAPGPAERGFVAGDMHAENLGVYRAESKAAVFDLDDFDDATVAPLRYDVVRGATSLLLAALQLDPAVDEALAVARELIAAYVRGRGAPEQDRRRLPLRITARLREVEREDDQDLRKHRLERVRGCWHYVRGNRYADLPASLHEAAPRLLHLYFGALGERAPRRVDQLHLEDAAWRIAGNGSIGMRRIAYALRRERRTVLVELKEARTSALELVGVTATEWSSHAARVVAAARILPFAPARGLAGVVDPEDGVSYVGRRLTPQLDRVHVLEDFGRRIGGYARVFGERLAGAHSRGVRAAAELGLVEAADPDAWSDPAIAEQLLDAAVRLAGLHRAVHLAYVRLAPGFDPA